MHFHSISHDACQIDSNEDNDVVFADELATEVEGHAASTHHGHTRANPVACTVCRVIALNYLYAVVEGEGAVGCHSNVIDRNVADGH